MFGEKPIEAPQQFVFILLPQFSMLPVVSALEPLRLANRAYSRDLYRWSIALTQGHTTASNGLALQPQIPLSEVDDAATLVVCGGLDPHINTPKSLAPELRRRERHGADIGSLCTGSYALAKAGLLTGYRCTIHWENLHTFQESFPDTQPTENLFEVDRNRFTCAGGAAGMDMMLALISEQYGIELAGEVAEQIVYSPVRSHGEVQRPAHGARIGMHHPKLARVLGQMEARIENPVSSGQLARETGLSTRQLERLFRRYLGRSPKRYYLELRLKHARKFLLQTDMPVIEVAVACGFTSASHFSKCYRGFFATTPYRERGMPER